MAPGNEELESIEPREDLPTERLANARHELGEHNGVNMSIEVSDTFVFKNPENMGKAFLGEVGPETGTYIYSRHYNPTVLNFSHQLAAIEGTETAYCTSSGMAAISSVLLELCKNGGHVVAAECLYGGTYALLKHFLPEECNITTVFVDITKHEDVEKAIVKGKTNVLYFESISNPTLVVANIPELSKIAHEKGVKVVVDNTFAPMILSPAKLGADVVVHSLTKYFSGGSDLIAGAICGPKEIVKPLMDLSLGPLMILGPTMNPREAYELSARLPHLSLRVKKQCNRAMKLAQRIKELDPSLRIIYPGLKDHPQHNLLDSMRNKGCGFGALISIDMVTSEKANLLLNKLENKYNFGFIAVSLGYYENLMCASGSSTSSEMDPETMKRLGITLGLIRCSIGYLGTLDQKWNQFKNAYKEMEE
uniref:Cystathionine gamma-synthase n=1 Tax=Populus alba x Populus glandulosa TaxID=153471 RepID=K0E4C9_9ROSI|nr:cystathionine gamma-synthase [Populus alba x Populus glandulosa]AFT92010.1 cystathionine gamma-synthase [Populus alba x Populus glandulosa]